MNGGFAPVISFDTSAAGPAGRGSVVVVDELGAGVVVGADFPLLPLEHADANSASTAHATNGRTLSRCCTSTGLPPDYGYERWNVTTFSASGKLVHVQSGSTW